MRRATAILIVSFIAFTALGEMGKPRTDLNLRTAPAVRARNVITVLSTSDRLEILETRRAWYRVRVVSSGTEGWVAKKHVDILPPEAPPAPVESAASTTKTVLAWIVALLIGIAVFASTRTTAPASPTAERPLPVLIRGAVIGALYIGLTLPKGLLTLGTDRGWSTLASFGEFGLAFNQWLAENVAPFPTLMRFLFLATVLYLLSLLLLAMRHRQPKFFGAGSATLIGSIAVFHVLAWAGYVVVKILTFVFWIFAVIARFFGAILVAIGGWIGSLFLWIYEILHALLGGLWWLVPACMVIALVAYIAMKAGGNATEMLRIVGALLLVVTAVGVAGFAIRWLWRFVEPWIVAILTFLGSLFARLVGGVLVLLALATIGQVLVDQFRGALSAGRRERGIFLGALAIGSSIAILLLVSNLYGVAEWLPSAAALFAGEYLRQPVPLLDAIITLLVVSLSVVGIWRNMPALGDDLTDAEFRLSIVYAIVGTLGLGAITAVGTQTED